MPVGRIYEPPPRFGKKAYDFESLKKPGISIPITIKTDSSNNHHHSNIQEEEEEEPVRISIPIRIVKEPSPPLKITVKIPVLREEDGGNDIEDKIKVEEGLNSSLSRPLVINKINPSPEKEILNGKVIEEEFPREKTPENSLLPHNKYEVKDIKYEGLDFSFITKDHAKGLRNLGNTCFMNSTIQCLSHSPSILELIRKDRLSSTSGKSDLTTAFVDVIRDLWSIGGPGESRMTTDPSSFKREIGIFAPKFCGYSQHDSQEFLQYLLEGIHNELNRVSPDKRAEESKRLAKRTTRDEDSLSARGPKKYGVLCFERYLLRDDSFVTDLFMGQFRSTLKCLRCENESVTFEPFWVVSLPIPSRTLEPKLEDCFRLFVKEEILDGDEKPTCDKCDKTRQKCSKWYSFERWPQILVVHFKRFESSRFRSKITHHIDVPLNHLDLREFNSPSEKYERVSYNCFGISNHSGSLQGGHYTAYGRHPVQKPNWFLYNDSFVSKAGGDSVVSHEAYLLFFEKNPQLF